MERRRFEDLVGKPSGSAWLPPEDDPSVDNGHSWGDLVDSLMAAENLGTLAQRADRALTYGRARNTPTTLLLLRPKGRPTAALADAIVDAFCAEGRRPNDHVAVLDGELFAMLLPDTDGPGAVVVARRMVERLRQDASSKSFRMAALALGLATSDGTSSTQGTQLVTRAERHLERAGEHPTDCLVSETGLQVLDPVEAAELSATLAA